MGNNKAIEKVNFIRNNVADFMSINPFLESSKIKQIKRLLVDAGFYKTAAGLCDSAIINLILKAQGKESFKPHQRKVNAKQTYF